MSHSPLAIYGAISVNVAIAVTKFTVAGITGSSAMLSEGVHSAVDTFNGLLLLMGIRLSRSAMLSTRQRLQSALRHVWH
ncbi:Cation transport protein [Polaromonas sp. CG9_12]|nr:divalent metal cation (Fe/Co/Zn/Cd) transporter [Polaromonas sp. CG_9.11]CDS51720.1 Cation transport protein [Polaromonas sp. CG9_12]